MLHIDLIYGNLWPCTTLHTDKHSIQLPTINGIMQGCSEVKAMNCAISWSL